MYSMIWARDVVLRFLNSTPRAQELERTYEEIATEYREKRSQSADVGDMHRALAYCVARGQEYPSMGRAWRGLKRIVASESFASPQAVAILRYLCVVEHSKGRVHEAVQGMLF